MKNKTTNLHADENGNEFQNQVIEKQDLELNYANNELALQIENNAKQRLELAIANFDLSFKNIDLKKSTEELIIANKELLFQNEEKEKRAYELIIANKELLFQNNEKAKRASELVIANIELEIQNEEKEKRAAELTLAYSELEKTEAYLNEYIVGLEKMMFMTSHKVRQPVTNIIGLTNQLDDLINSPEELKKLIDHIKQSALSLDAFTKELTAFIGGLEKEGKNQAHEHKHLNTLMALAPIISFCFQFFEFHSKALLIY